MLYFLINQTWARSALIRCNPSGKDWSSRAFLDFLGFHDSKIEFLDDRKTLKFRDRKLKLSRSHTKSGGTLPQGRAKEKTRTCVKDRRRNPSSRKEKSENVLLETEGSVANQLEIQSDYRSSKIAVRCQTKNRMFGKRKLIFGCDCWKSKRSRSS